MLDPNVFFYSFELNVLREEIKLNCKPVDEDPAQVFSNFSSISVGLKFKSKHTFSWVRDLAYIYLYIYIYIYIYIFINCTSENGLKT